MKSSHHLTRKLAVFLTSWFCALAIFGLTLGLAWQLGNSRYYKTLTALGAAALAFIAGGSITGLLAKSQPDTAGLIFGCFWGTLSCIYLFGPRWQTLPGIFITTMLGMFGSRLATFYRRS